MFETHQFSIAIGMRMFCLLFQYACFSWQSRCLFAVPTRQDLALGNALPSTTSLRSGGPSSGQHQGQVPATGLRALPDLRPLAACLRSLSLSTNHLTQFPDWLPDFTRLEHLDVTCECLKWVVCRRGIGMGLGLLLMVLVLGGVDFLQQ